MRIIKTKLFQKAVKQVGITPQEEMRLFEELLKDPKTGDVIQGSGGLRKIRLALGNRGKSKGARVIYTILEMRDNLYLLWAYAKKDKQNLTQGEINNLRRLVDIIREELK